MTLPPAYCVWCSQLAERRRVTEDHLAERGLAGIHWWRGFHGRTWGLRTDLWYHPDYRMSAGHVGCLLSHYALWLHLEAAGVAEALVLEDDVVLCEGFVACLEAALSVLPEDWQFVFAGWLDRPELPRRAVHGLVCEMAYPFCTHCYLVRSSALPVLLDTMAEVRAHVDIQLGENALPRLRTYCLTPSLAEQRSVQGEWSTQTSAPDAA